MPSQYNESQLIAELLPKQGGIYVDVGAGDPWQYSNTGDLYRFGWKGMLIEPLIERCQMLIRERPLDVVVNKAVSHQTGTKILHVAGDLSSLDPGWRNNSVERREIETDTLSNILISTPDIRDCCDLCSIDVEGHEAEVLQGVDFTTFRPELFVVESLAHETCLPTWPEWETILLEQSYEFVASGEFGLNRFYRRKR